MSHIILVSDGEDEPDIAFVGTSKLKAPMIIDDSDEDDFSAMCKNMKAILGDAKGRVPPIRSALLDALDDINTHSFRKDTPPTADELDEPAPPKKAKKASVPTEASRDAVRDASSNKEREAAKARDKAEKQRQKEEAKLAKEVARSLAQKEKDVNRLRTSKNETLREIHVYISPDLQRASSVIAAALPEIRIRIEGNQSQLHTLSDFDCPLPNIIRFKRHVQARFDAKSKRWIPLDRDRWEWESTVLLVVNAEEVVDKVAEGGGALSDWANDVRLTIGMKAPDQLLVMIKGLQKYNSKTKSLATREFTAAARASMGERDPHVRPTAVRPSKEAIESELVRLQVGVGCFFIQVEKTEDIEDWVTNLAADIAIRPYKLLQKAHLNFCPADHVKKGSTPKATFELMLQEVQGITPSAAAGIAAEYPCFRDLMEAFERKERRGQPAADEMLQDCEVRNLRNGTANGRRLNKALAKRVYQVFRGEDSLAFA